jgi:hypothetical protein
MRRHSHCIWADTVFEIGHRSAASRASTGQGTHHPIGTDRKSQTRLRARRGGAKKSDTDKSKLRGEARTDQTALDLSREEIQLIKEYIKPAPAAGPASPAINVGDPISGAMIPLPSPLTEKVPKLLGGKFTTRDGTIIIVKRASRPGQEHIDSRTKEGKVRTGQA